MYVRSIYHDATIFLSQAQKASIQHIRMMFICIP